MLKKLISSLRSPLRRKRAIRTTPEIVGSNQHPLRREQFSRHAVSVVDRLQKAGYQAYIVGGGVRDQLLGITPKDFDVATSATPEQVRAEFRNARVIGRRFKLVHVHFGREIIEVATFRAHHPRKKAKATATRPRATKPGASCATTSTAPWKTTPSAATSPSTPCTSTAATSASSTTPTACTTSATAWCA